VSRPPGHKKVAVLNPETAAFLDSSINSLSGIGVDDEMRIGRIHIRKQTPSFDPSLVLIAWMRAAWKEADAFDKFAANVSGWPDLEAKRKWIDRVFGEASVLAMNLCDQAFFEQWALLQSELPSLKMRMEDLVTEAYEELRRAMEKCSGNPWRKCEGSGSDQIVLTVCTPPVVLEGGGVRKPSLHEILLYLGAVGGVEVDRDDLGKTQGGVGRDAIARRYAAGVLKKYGLQLADSNLFPGNWRHKESDATEMPENLAESSESGCPVDWRDEFPEE